MFARRVLIVEDDPFLRGLLVEVCASRNFETRGAGSFSEALGAFGELDPDLVVLDIDLGPGPSGFDFGAILEDEHPEIARLYLTRFADLKAAGYQHSPTGRVGYLHKESIQSIDDFMDSVQSMFKDDIEPRRDDRSQQRPLGALSSAQIEVLRLASSGLSNGAIARRRSTSESAIEGLWTGIFRSLQLDRSEGINLRVAAIKRYIEANGLPPRFDLQS
jgi:DNA-binding NarL/FixJ family response regulator